MNEIKSPLTAIKEFCRECMGELGEVTNSEHLEILGFVRECKAQKGYYKDGWYCKLWEYRLGKTERGNYPDVTPLKSIRLQCRECVETDDDIKNCFCDGKHECNGIKNYKCQLYDFRFGKNPFTKVGKNLTEEDRKLRSERMKILRSKIAS